VVGVPSFSSEEKNSAFTFCLFAWQRRNFNAKIVSFEEERGTKNKKRRKKRETRQDSLFYSLFY